MANPQAHKSDFQSLTKAPNIDNYHQKIENTGYGKNLFPKGASAQKTSFEFKHSTSALP